LKDEFLSWFSSATILAIDANDNKQLESLKEKYSSLNRLSIFEQSFASYGKNKIKCFIEEVDDADKAGGNGQNLQAILQQVFDLWKRCKTLADMFMGNADSSSLISKNLYEGVLGKWEIILKMRDQY